MELNIRYTLTGFYPNMAQNNTNAQPHIIIAAAIM